AKISPSAVEGAGFGAPGTQTWYVQSRCYYEIAVQTGNAKLCAKKFGGIERQRTFASGKNLRVSMPLEIPTPPVREGVPFDVKAAIRNDGSTPIDAGAGVLLLLTNYPSGFTIRAADLARPLPKLGPGETKTVTFEGLTIHPPPGASHPRWIE